MRYPKEVIEYIKVKLETEPNNTRIAREVLQKFDIDVDKDSLRRYVSIIRKRLKIQAKKVPVKRLFFDIETGYYLVRLWRIGKVGYVSPEQIKEDKQIFCICYKWQGDDKVYSLDYRMGEREMLKEFIKIMGQAHECVAHNGDNFDVKEVRTRAIYYGLLMYPQYRTLDTLKKARSYFRFASNKLDYIGKYLNVGGKMEHEGLPMWVKVQEQNDEEALEKMIEYCKRDVIVLEDAYTVMAPFIDHNNNFAVLTGGERWECPECRSDDVKMFRTYTTPMGIIRREMKCNNCKKQYKVSNKTYMDMLAKEGLYKGNE